MDNPAPNPTSKDRVFRAIGRNLINFQRLEKTLKWLAELRPFIGLVPDIYNQLERRRQRTQGSTLGTVIPLWLETAQGQEPQLAKPKGDLDAVISFWVELNIPPPVLDEHAKELDQLRTERNWLVHTGLAEVDFNSSEECESLLARLDDQNSRLGKQMDFVDSIGNSILELKQNWARDDVQEILRRELFGEKI